MTIRRTLTALLICSVLAAGFFARVREMHTEGMFRDVYIVEGWGIGVIRNGFGHAYTFIVNDMMPPNYPPANLAIFGAVARIYGLLGYPVVAGAASFNMLMRVPAFFFDILFALLLFGIVDRYGKRKDAIFASLIYWLHPVVWLVSSVWGQTDWVFSFFAVGALVSLARRRSFLAGTLFVTALLLKATTVFIVPAVVVTVLRDRKQLPRFTVGGLLTGAVILLPFVLEGTVMDIVHRFTNPDAVFRILSLSAYNAWWGFFSYHSYGIEDSTLIAGTVSYRTVSLMLVSVAYAAILLRFWRSFPSRTTEPQRLTAILSVASMCALSFFMLSTRMHERYFILGLACAAPLAFLLPRTREPLLLLSFSLLMNIIIGMRYFSAEPFAMNLMTGAVAWINIISVLWLFAVLWKDAMPVQNRERKT